MSALSGGMKMNDKLETIGKGSLIQHGSLNDRIYLMKLAGQDASIILERLSELARKNNYSKIFCKIPKWIAPIFLSDGYIQEANIPRFYNDEEDALFVSKFLDSNRQLAIEKGPFEAMSSLLKGAHSIKKRAGNEHSEYQLRKLNESDVEKITEIYKEVFLSYPFPIHDPKYILETMNKNVQYYGAAKNNELVAIASSEMDIKGLNAEMTDFATRKKALGNNLSVLLLQKMEVEMKEQGIKTLYTIARLNSVAMNKTFLKLDYCYSGTLINNTNIAGNIESMNVYHKSV